jgi:predicted nucleic acid-binding protein
MVANSDDLFLSVMTALELEAGLIKLGRLAPGRWHEKLSEWFSSILLHYNDRILPLDLAVARIASLMTDRSKARGLYPGMADVTIAATALAHNQILLTRNLKHFEALEVATIDPFERLPS